MDGGNKGKQNCLKRKMTYFLEGLSLLLSLRVGLNGAPFCVKRYQIPEELFSIYVSKMHNGMELGCFLAVILGNIYVLTGGKWVEEISIAFNWANYLAHIAIMVLFMIGGNDGYLTAFYYALVLCAFIYGIMQVCVFKIGGSSLVFFLAAVPMSGIVVSCFQMTFSYLVTEERFDDPEYMLITFQIALSIMITLVTACLWTMVFLDDIAERKKGKSSNESGQDLESGEQNGQEQLESSQDSQEVDRQTSQNGEQAKKEKNQWWWLAISPMFMCIIGLGLVYAIYPGVAPGMLVDFRFVNKIDMIIMVVGAIPSIMVALVSEMTQYGPNRKWDNKNWMWHLFIIFPIMECIIAVLFIRVLHFRRTYLANLFKKPMVAGAFTVIFFFCHAVSIGVGFPGVGPNSNSNMATVNLFLSLLLMNIMQFVGEGYVTELKSQDRYNWPTVGMKKWEAFWFWVNSAVKNGVKSVKSFGTTNFRQDMMSVLKKVATEETD